MRLGARQGVSKAVNELSDGIREAREADSAEETADALERAVEGARDTLVLLLERDVHPDDLVERYDSGARVRLNIQRGENPRDQEEWTIEGKGQDHEEARAEFDALFDRFRDRWADEARGFQPGDGGD
jgi:hypothetical protein